jgi:hypothetical protein
MTAAGMKAVIAFLVFTVAACSSGSSGPGACVAAGGSCVIGGNTCSNRGTQDCNPDRNPGGAFCCLSCPTDAQTNDAGGFCN